MARFTPQQITYLENVRGLIRWQNKEWINEFHLRTWLDYIEYILRRGEYRPGSKDADDLNKLSKLYKLLK